MFRSVFRSVAVTVVIGGLSTVGLATSLTVGSGAASAQPEIRGRPGLELAEVSALRLCGTARALTGVTTADWAAFEEGGRTLDESTCRAREAGAYYELALALVSRVALRQLATGTEDRDPWEGDTDALGDLSSADEILNRLGVHRAVITWEPLLSGNPITAEPSGVSA